MVERKSVFKQHKHAIIIVYFLITLLLVGLGYFGFAFKADANSGARIVIDPGSDVVDSPLCGAYVVQVFNDSPAQRAGLVPDSIITAVDKKPIYRISDFSNVLATIREGQEFLIIFENRTGSYARTVSLDVPMNDSQITLGVAVADANPSECSGYRAVPRKME